LPHESMVVRGLGHESTPADFYERRRSEAPAADRTDPHWQSAVVQVSFRTGALGELRLHPIEFGIGLPRGQAGRPVLAEGKAAAEVIERFARLSKAFGTAVSVEGETGVIRVG